MTGRVSQYRPELDGLRGIAVLLVVVFHLIPAALPGGGRVGVAIFFVLSGYLITGLLMSERSRTGSIDLRRFYVRRIRRLLPGFAFMVAVVVILATLIGRGSVVGHGALYAIGYVGNTVDGELLGPFRHTWSLAVEEQFYLVMPAAFLLAMRGRVWGIGVGILASAIAIALGAFVPLGIGCALALTRWRWASWPASVVALAVLLALSTWKGDNDIAVSLVTLVLLGDRSAILRFRPWPALGKISYAVYLWHYPIIVAGTWLTVYLDLDRLAMVSGMFVLSIFAGWLSTRYVEAPFRSAPTLDAVREARRAHKGAVEPGGA